MLGRIVRDCYTATLGKRRLKSIVNILAPYIPESGNILDLGCGRGDIAATLMAQNPKLHFTGVDTLQRSDAKIPIHTYDGRNIGFADGSFDYVMMITVLHHVDDYLPLLREAKRVAKKGIIIFDHQYHTKLEWWILAIIDWPGNVPFGVYTPFNFKKREEWLGIFDELGMKEVKHNDRTYLFGKWMNFILGRRMHFISVLCHD